MVRAGQFPKELYFIDAAALPCNHVAAQPSLNSFVEDSYERFYWEEGEMYLRNLRATMLVLALMLIAAGSVSAGWFSNHRGIRGSGDMASEDREVKEFTAIECSGSMDLEVTVGERQSVVIYFDDNLLENIVTRVRRGRLEIYAEESFNSRLNCRVEITLPVLEEIELSGSGDARIEEIGDGPLDCHISGSGDLIVSGLTGGRLNYSASGSGGLDAEGEVDEISIKISGSGDVDARRLIARDATVKISGSGDVKVYASESFDGRVSGSGDIDVYGDPDHSRGRATGSGDIRRR